VPDKGRFGVAIVIEKRDEITGKMFNVVGGHVVGAGRVTIAPLVGDDDMIARSNKRGDLMAPGIGMLGPSVTEYDWMSCIFSACFKDFQFNPVDWNKRRLGKICCGRHGTSFYGSGDQVCVQPQFALRGFRLSTVND
jgi:hypothetical protein